MKLKRIVVAFTMIFTVLLSYLVIWQVLKSQAFLSKDITNQTMPTSSFPPSETTQSQDLSPEYLNIQTVKQANGKKVAKNIPIDEFYSFKIDATVNTTNVEQIGTYEYIPYQITTDQRTALFDAYFQERASEVYHHTVGNSDNWQLKTESEHYYFGYSGTYMHVIEPLFCLYNVNTGPAINSAPLPSLDEVSFTLNEATAQCTPIIDSLAGGSEYEIDKVLPIKTVVPSAEDCYWITYRRIIDGMPLTAHFDLTFFVTNSEVIKIWGSLYDLESLTMDSYIITVDEAILNLEKYASLIDGDFFFKEVPTSVTEITFEYLAIQNADMRIFVTPVWRFRVGSDEEQRLRNSDTVVAINALTGELIVEIRGR